MQLPAIIAKLRALLLAPIENEEQLLSLLVNTRKALDAEPGGVHARGDGSCGRHSIPPFRTCHRLWQAGPLAGRLLARGGGLGLGGSHRILAVCPPSVAGVASTSAKAELRAYSRVHRVFERVGCETPVQHRTISGFQSLLPVARRTAAHALSVKSLLCRGFAAMVPRLAIESPPICD